MKLRPYQQAALDAIDDHLLDRGRRAVLLVMPTGSGKTVVFARLPALLGARRTLVLAHRRELLDQAAAKLRATNPALQVEIEQAERSAHVAAQVIVASVATIGRKDSKRLARLRPDAIDLVIVDEAHHAPAAMYRRILDACTDAWIVGVTATPERGDGQGLDDVFEAIAYDVTLPELVEQGYLAPIRAWRVDTETDLAGVKRRGGDFVEADLARVVDTDDRNALAVAAYEAYAAGKRAVVFCAGVQHAHHLAGAFSAAGHPAECVHGGMGKVRRAGVLRRFREGLCRVVTNCAVLTEGFDDPGIEAIVMARPTQSGALYRQCVGRGTRLHPGKDYLALIDLADTTRHSIVGAATLYGVAREIDPDGEDLRTVAQRAAVEDERELVQAAADEERARIEAEEAKKRSWSVPLFEGARDEVRRYSRLCWVAINTDRWLLAVDRGLRLELTLEGEAYRVHGVDGARVFGGEVEFRELREAVWAADKWVYRARPDRARLLEHGAYWRALPASPRQVALLEKLRVRVPEAVTKGQAQELLDATFARRRGRGPSRIREIPRLLSSACATLQTEGGRP